MKKRQHRILSCIVAAAASLMLTSCGGSGTFSPTITGTQQQGPVTVTVTPASQTINIGGTQQFTATVTGTGDTAVTWSVTSSQGGDPGTISANGFYTAPTSFPKLGSGKRISGRQAPGDESDTITITATSVAFPSSSGSATVTLTNIPVTVTVTPGTENLDTGETQQFTATVTGTSNTSVTWSLSSNVGGNPGTITASGLYTAPNNLPKKGSVKRPGSKQAPGDSATITVTATSTAFPNVSGSAIVNLELG